MRSYFFLFKRLWLDEKIPVDREKRKYCKSGGWSVVIDTLKKIYLEYWRVAIVFIPIGFMFFSKQEIYADNAAICTKFNSFSVSELFKAILGISHFNNEWWFFSSYIVVILTFPLAERMIRGDFWKCYFGIVIYSILNIVVFPWLRDNAFTQLSDDWVYTTFIIQRSKAPLFYLGMLFGKCNALEILSASLKDTLLKSPFSALVVLIINIPLRISIYGKSTDLIMIPLTIVVTHYILSSNKRLKKIFSSLGKHSSVMWMSHSFFCYYFGHVQKIVYMPRLALLIAVWFVMISWYIAFIFDIFWKSINKRYKQNSL